MYMHALRNLVVLVVARPELPLPHLHSTSNHADTVLDNRGRERQDEDTEYTEQ